ncbi:hypothetical protein PFICI_02661 [Pestalotiopsis fici W106-1]|uniref:AAA+ ATPase domain-containing protein n=1 Tax=Pestalotiopsis fici (strain W106-1 / CGMCC3.15140) TaxID=1229662 RepID=W3XHD3_PESFW|nr:uncharacterized protein PFICI_02661 [Pestalotiopsis fici W106-1]ETS84636.1 hypothetical protein PFICI_02661 [Pestalotiopsis fici W106-1]
MGKIFSKQTGSTVHVPASDESSRSPVTLPPSSIQRDVPPSSTSVPYGSSSRQAVTIQYTNPSYTTSTSHLEISPLNTNFSGAEHDESTVYGNAGSLNSPVGNMKMPPSTHRRASSWDSSFPKIHPVTQLEVFRSGSFGDKDGVQIVCGHVLKALRQVVASSEVSPDDEIIISRDSWIMEPYELIVYNKVRIEEHRRETTNDVAKKHLEMLLDFLNTSQLGVCQKFDEVQSHKCQNIRFKHLFLLYTPRTTVFKVDNDAWRAYVIEKSETMVGMKPTSLRIHAWFLDFNNAGDKLIPHRATFEVSQFSSERPIKHLELLPEWFIESQNSPRQELIDRGWKHWSYGKAPSHKEYRGTAWRQAPYETPLMVIVDYTTSSRCVQTGDATIEPDSTSSRCSACVGDSLGLFSFPHAVESPRGSHVCVNDVTMTHSRSEGSPTEDSSMLLFCPPKLWAFSLRFKTWSLVSHSDLKEVEPQENPFDDELYMDSTRKKSLSGIVSSYLNSVSSHGDNYSPTRKVRGLNILLSGSSGTGKTFTAECLARKFGIALYTVTTGDLGVEPTVFDQRLQETLTRATNWNAMVLLDDVDLYSKERTGYNNERAALLPTFLRDLEYSKCLCFISMISQEGVDPAFSSRIHLAVPFPKFDFESQKAIWHSLIEGLCQDGHSKFELSRFVNGTLRGLDQGEHTNMNARQIKNCMDVALVLAQNEGPGAIVMPHHVETVLELGMAFKAHIMQESGTRLEVIGEDLFI